MPKRYLLTPGPTEVPPEISLAGARPIIHHRSPEFRKLFAEIQEGLKIIFQTRNDCLVFASSGTGGMEAAIVNLLSPGDMALVVKGGKFGERWAEICQAYGVHVISVDVPSGEAVDPHTIENELRQDSFFKIKAVFTTLAETSTGVATDINAIGRIVRNYKAVLVVDAISGLGSCELRTDNWLADVCVAGSQKGLMLPPGLAFATVSEKAWRLVGESKLPKYYWSFEKAKNVLSDNQTAFTPAISLLMSLKESLSMLRAEGLDNILDRHKRLASACRTGIIALGLQLFARHPADNVTSVKMPPGIHGETFIKRAKDVYGVSLAGGQGELKNKIFRVSHLGYTDTFDVITAISCIEMVLIDLGMEGIEPGAGVRAAMQVLRKGNKARNFGL